MTIEINDFFIKKKKKTAKSIRSSSSTYLMCLFNVLLRTHLPPPLYPPLPPFLQPLPPLPLPIFANYYYYTLLLQKMNLYELCVMNDVW